MIVSKVSSDGVCLLLLSCISMKMPEWYFCRPYIIPPLGHQKKKCCILLLGHKKNSHTCCILYCERCNNHLCCNLASYQRDKHHYQRKNNMESLVIVIFVSLWTKSWSFRLTNTIRIPCKVLTRSVETGRLYCKMERNTSVIFILHV